MAFEELINPEFLDDFREYIGQRSGVEFAKHDEGYLLKRLTDLCLAEPDIWSPERILEVFRGASEIRDEVLGSVLRAVLQQDLRFFNELKTFKFIRHQCLPTLVRAYPKTEVLNFWVTDGRKGQEAYSLATMLYKSAAARNHIPFRVYVSNVDPIEAEYAKAGLYTQSEIEAGLPQPVLKGNFEAQEGKWGVAPRIRDEVEFLDGSLLEDLESIPICHVVIGKDSLVYFSAENQAELYRKLTIQTIPGAYLIMGDRQNLLVPEEYEELHAYETIVAYHIRGTQLPLRNGEASVLYKSDFKQIACVDESENELNMKDRTHLAKFVRNTNLFVGLSANQVDSFCRKLKVEEFEADEVILEEGEMNRRIHIIVSGHASVIIGLGVFKKPQEIATLKAGNLFGEMSLILKTVSTATVCATTPVKTICIKKAQFDTLYEENADFANKIRTLVSKRLEHKEAFKHKRNLSVPTLELISSNSGFESNTDYELTWNALPKRSSELELDEGMQKVFTSLMRHYKMFDKIDFATIENLWRYIRIIELPEKICVVKEGVVSSAVFVIYDGEVDIHVGDSFLSSGELVCTLEEGDLFGEISVIMKESAIASAYTVEKTTLFVIAPKLFECFYVNNRSFSNELRQIIQKRLGR